MSALAWSPARPKLPRLGGAASKGFIDSPAMDLFVSVSATVPAGLLAVIYGNAGSKWASLFWVVAGLAAFKGLSDLSRLVETAEGA